MLPNENVSISLSGVANNWSTPMSIYYDNEKRSYDEIDTFCSTFLPKMPN